MAFAHDVGKFFFVLRFHGADARFGAIGQHQQRRFARTRARARIAELFRIHFGFVTACGFNRFGVLVAGEHGAMMFEDEIVDAPRQAMFARQLDTIQDMLSDSVGAFCRLYIIVCVKVARRLILDEKCGVLGLADIVEKRAHAREQRVCANVFSGLLGQVSHLQTVLIRARRIAQEELQQGKIGTGDLEQLQRRGQPQGLRQEVLQQQGDAG